MNIKKNDVIEVSVDTLSYGGRGIGRYNGIVVFIPHSVPGDVVKAIVRKKKSKYLEATIEELITPSPVRQKPECRLYGDCGGCSWQNIPYEKQLEYKQEIAKSMIEHIGGQFNFTVHPILRSPRIWRYRNKVDYTFGRDDNGETVLGFHRKGSYFEILDVENCLIQPKIFDELIDVMRSFAREKGIPPYDPKTHEGRLRHFMLRCASNYYGPNETPPVLAILTTAEKDLPDVKELIDRMKERCPTLCGFIHGLNSGKGDVFNVEERLFEWGEDFLIEKLEDLELRISGLSFFQTNTQAAEKLYTRTLDFLSLSGTENLLDAYCGAGSIGIFCAKKAREVYGIEILREAVWDARINAARNGLDNCLFLCGDMKTTLPLLLERARLGIQRIVVDPPRSGLDKKSLRRILGIKSSVIVYVSCNPTTMARDANTICNAGYDITDIQPLDMFPQTFHIEMVARFEKRS
mgnify:CR=1 FL=1